MFEIKKINGQNIEAVFKLYQKINLYNKSSVTFLETMKKPSHIGFCGYMNNTLSSFLSAIHVLDEIDIIEIGVIKQQRRRGVAYKLVSHLQKHCIKNGIRKIFLGVAENNIAIMQALAGQAASLAKEFNAGELIQNIWAEIEEKFV